MNKKYVEFFLVSGTEAFKKTGSLVSGSAINLNNLQLGVVSADPTSTVKTPNQFLAGGETAAQVKAIKIVQGTSKSANPSYTILPGYTEVPFRESPVIYPGDVKAVECNVFPVDTHSAVFVESMTIAGSKTYSVSPIIQSYRNERDYTFGLQQMYHSVDTPATIPGNSSDYVVNKLLTQVNLDCTLVKGNKFLLGLGVSVTGGAGAAIGALQVGDVVPFFTYKGITYSFTVTKGLLQTLKAAIDNTSITATSTIENVGSLAAGSGASRAMLFIGLDQDGQALAVDTIPSTKTYVEVQLGDDFYADPLTPNFTKGVASVPVEDMGKGKFWQIRFDERGRTFNQSLAGFSDCLVKQPEDIDPTKEYCGYMLQIESVSKPNSSDTIEHNSRVWILAPRTDNAGSTTANAGITTASTAAVVTDLNAVLGAWIISDATPKAYIGASTPSQLFF